MMGNAMKKSMILGAATALMIFATACSQLQKSLDVVGKESIISFETMINALPHQIEAGERNTGWSLIAPNGSVRFIWSKDWSESPLYDVMLEFDAAPFLDAGLDLDKLPENYSYYENMLAVGTKFGGDILNYTDNPTPLAAYEQIVNLKRDSIVYHMETDHFGVDLGGGNMFDWAKDMRENDKDILFVLNPEPLINAGVDPNRVIGWSFAKVTVHANGKPMEMDRFLKPFDLK